MDANEKWRFPGGPGNGGSSNPAESSGPDVAEIYANEFSALVFSARRVLGDPGEAEDAAQEAFLYLITSGNSFASREDAVRFLRWKVKNLAIDKLRRVGPLSLDPTDEAGVFQTQVQPGYLDEFETAEEAAIVSIALAKLPARQRESLVRQHVLGQSIELAATEMELSPNALRQLSSRGRKSFVTTLTDELSKRGLSPREFLRGRYLKILGAASALVMLLTVGNSLQSVVQQPTLSATSASSPSAFIGESNSRAPIAPKADLTEVFVGAPIGESALSSQVVENQTILEPLEVEYGQSELVLADDTPETRPSITAGEQPVSPVVSPELQLSSETSTYLESRLVTNLTNANKSFSSLKEDERFVRTATFAGEGIEAAIRFLDDGSSDTGTAWVYFLVTDQLAGSYWIAPSVHHLSLERDQSGSLVGISLTATDFIVGDASGQHQFRASSSSGLADIYFFMEAEVKGSALKKVSFKTENFTLRA